MRLAFLLPMMLFVGHATADTFDFAYEILGDPRVAPIQVFDNGSRTWLQFRQPDPPPTIFAVTVAGQAILSGHREDQFIVLERVERQLAIAIGAARATVRYIGSAARNDEAAMFGTTAPTALAGKAPPPVPAQQVLAARQTAPRPADSKPADSKPADSKPAEARAAPVESKVVAAAAEEPSAAAAVAEEPSAAAPEKPVWRMYASDGFVATTLARWGHEARWTVKWEAPRFFEAQDAEFTGTFEEAVEAVVLGLSESDAPVKVRFIDDGKNKTARILRYQGNSAEGARHE